MKNQNFKLAGQFISLPTHEKQKICIDLGYQSTYYQEGKTLQDSDKDFFKWAADNGKLEEVRKVVPPLYYAWYLRAYNEPHPDTIEDTNLPEKPEMPRLTKEHEWMAEQLRSLGVIVITDKSKPDTSSGEKPDFSDPLFIKKLDDASGLLQNVATMYANTNYGTHEYSSAVARYSFIRGYNFANHAIQSELTRLKIELSNYAYQIDRAKRDRDKAESENEKLREENASLKAENDSRKFC